MYIFEGLAWWQIIFIVMGILAPILGFVSLFFAFGERTSYLWSSNVPEVGTEDFLEAVAQTTNTSVQWGSQVKILNSGQVFVSAMLDAFRQARASINITAYIWEPGKMSDKILKVLIAKAKEGVEVRILLDHLGALWVSGKSLDLLEKQGAKIERFRTPRFGKLLRFHRRTHRRAIIVDGKVGFTGGMAIGDKWYGGEKGEPEWRDMMFELTGSMARALQGVFAELWAGTHGEILIGAKFYPNPGKEQDKSCRYVSVASSPAPDTQPLPKFYWLSIAGVKEKLYVASPYVVPDEHIRKAFVSRALDGVDVRFLVPNKRTDAKPIRWAMHHYYEEYLNAGVKIYEYQPAMMHSKLLVADGKWSVIGSANMDNRSKRLNEENVIGIHDPKFAASLEQIFLNDIKDAKEIKLEEWKGRNLGARILERVFGFFMEQY